MLRFLVVLLSLAGFVLGGVQIATPEIEAEALRLWQMYCETSDNGQDGENFIYCKKSTDVIPEEQEHTISLDGIGSPDQTIFVQPPSYAYQHKLILGGTRGAGGKTVIYVKPQKNSHEYNVEDQREGGAEPQKPTLYFLRQSHGQAAAQSPEEGYN